MKSKYLTQRINVDFLSPNAYWEQFRQQADERKSSHSNVL